MEEDRLKLVEKVCDILITKDTLYCTVVLLYSGIDNYKIGTYPCKYLYCGYQVSPDLSQIVINEENQELVELIKKNYTNECEYEYEYGNSNFNTIMYAQHDNLIIRYDCSIEELNKEIIEYFKIYYLLDTVNNIYFNIWQSINYVLIYCTEFYDDYKHCHGPIDHFTLKERNIIGYVTNLQSGEPKVYNNKDELIEETNNVNYEVYLSSFKPKGITLPSIII